VCVCVCVCDNAHTWIHAAMGCKGESAETSSRDRTQKVSSIQKAALSSISLVNLSIFQSLVDLL